MRNLLIIAFALVIFTACSDSWDTHYNQELTDELVSDQTVYEFIEGESGYSSFFDMLKNAGIDQELNKDQFVTVWAVQDSAFDLSGIGNMDTSHVAEYHLNYLAFGASNLKDGLRIQALNGVYITINQNEGEYMANDTRIVSSKRFKNGIVHEIEEPMVPLVNMFEFIELLDDEYSMIRDSILTYNRKVFDRENSAPVGVDETGNTIYDSVFYTSNPLFEEIDFSSEFDQFTMFLPDNDVVEECFQKLIDQYEMMGWSFEGEDSVMAMDWIKEAIFHEGIIEDYDAQLDYVNPFDRVWRTTVQTIEPSSEKPLSNGVAYDVTNLKVPNNFIIDRIKSLVYYYTNLDDQQKEELYKFRGATEINVERGDETPVAGLYYWLLTVSGDPESNEEFSVEFTPLDYNEETDEVKVMKVPPGEYNLYMGFRSKGHPYVNVYFSQGSDPMPQGIDPVATEIPAANSTPWNYDRVNETDPDISKWNGLGGLVGVVNIEGDEMSSFRIKVEFDKLQSVGAVKRMQLYHWTLKPTENNY